MNDRLNFFRSPLDRATLRRIFEDVLCLFLCCSFNILFACKADPAFLDGICGAIVLVLCTALAIAVYSALTGGSNMLSLSVGMLLQTGLTVQALILQDSYFRVEEINSHAMIVALSVAAALILIPLFSKLSRCIPFDVAGEYLPVGLCVTSSLLLCLSTPVCGTLSRISFGFLDIIWPLAMMPMLLTVFSMILTRSDISPTDQVHRLLLLLLAASFFLLIAGALAQLAVLYLTVIVLCCLLLRDRKALVWFLGTIFALAAGTLLFTGLCSAAEHRGMELPGLLSECAGFFDKLTARLGVLFHGGDPLHEGYQLARVREALARSGLLPTEAWLHIPVARNTTTFAALIHRLGLLYGTGVLLILGCTFQTCLRVCKNATSPVSGGVGMVFLLYLTISALVSAASTLGLLPALGLDFPLLSASGTSLVVCSFMLVYLLHLSRTEALADESAWNLSRRERLAIRFVWAACLVISLTCGWLIFSGSAASEDAPAAETTEPSQQISAKDFVDQILEQEEFSYTHYPVNVSQGSGDYRDTVSHAYLDACRWEDVNPISIFHALHDAGCFTRLDTGGDAYTVDGWFQDIYAPNESFLTLYSSSHGYYPFNDYGARLFLYDVVEQSRWFENRLPNTGSLLDILIPTNDSYYIPFSLSDSCFFTYFFSQGEESSWVLCFYLYPDEDWTAIGSVEFQLLQIAHDRSPGDADLFLQDWGSTVCSLISAIDYQLHGHSRFQSASFTTDTDNWTSQLSIPAECWCENGRSSLEYFRYGSCLPGSEKVSITQDYAELLSFHLSK